MVNSGIFQWTQIEQEAWENVRFVVSLNIKNHIQNLFKGNFIFEDLKVAANAVAQNRKNSFGYIYF